MGKAIAATAFLSALIAFSPAGARPATQIETKTAYCVALLKPQVEYINTMPEQSRKIPAVAAQNAQVVSNLGRATAYLASRRKSIDPADLATAAERAKADIEESNSVSKACLQQCLAEVRVDATQDQRRTNIEYCTKFRACSNPAEERLNACRSMNWLPY